MLISSTIPNLVNGVSQQPDALRLASQAEAQDNFLSSVVEGLKRRPGTEHIARIHSASHANAFLHTINRDLNERYAMAILNGDLLIYDLRTGQRRTVNFPNGKAYLNGGSDRGSYRAVTVADYTFIVNRTKTVRMLPNRTPNRVNQALIYVTGGNYGRIFEVTIDVTKVASYTTPDGSESGHAFSIAASHIAHQLSSQMQANMSGGGWHVEVFDNVIRVRRSDGGNFNINATDRQNGQYLKVIKDEIQRFSDLPAHAPPGFIIEVTGEASSNFDNYYVQWDVTGNSYKSGTWKEAQRWNQQYLYDPATMPHILVREANGTFTFKPAEWEGRKVGDEESAPEASFVGRQITDVFFFKNRLGFAADENVVMSAAGDFFNFWPKTVTTMVDSDPIDIAVSHVKVSTINHAVPFNQSLLLFSGQTQFVMSGGEILSPSTVNIGATTEFDAVPNVRPVGAGPNIYFPTSRGRYTGVREYYVDGNTQTNNALDVTSHCPKYIPKDIFDLVSSTNEDAIIALTHNEPNRLYVYKYYYGEEGKLQSSWSRWTFGPNDNILSASFIESRLYLIIERPGDGVFLEMMNIETGASDEGTDLHYRVDRKIYEHQTSSITFDGTYTTWTLPYNEPSPLWVFIRAGDAEWPEGYIILHERRSPNTVSALGDWRGRKVCFGRRYQSYYLFSTFLIKEEVAGGGQASVGEGRLQILHMSIDYSDTGYFELFVTPEGRNPFKYQFTGRVMGSLNNRLGHPSLETGRMKVPVLSRNRQVQIEIKTDHFLPCSFMGAEWEGRYNARSRRL